MKKKTKTQEQKVLEHLKKYKRGITSMQAFQKYGITRLSAKIFNLRHMGYNIITIRETKDGNSYGRYMLREVKKDV